MLLITFACAAFAGLMIAVVALWQRRAPAPDALAHEKALYAGFMADIDRRMALGDIDDDQAREERAEAGRALLRAGETVVAAGPVGPAWVLGGGAAIAAVAFALYLFIGHPTLTDQPYKARLAQWTHLAATDPDSLPPDAINAVLRQAEATRGNEPDYWLFRGRMDMLTGHTYEGLKAYRRALALATPARFGAWSEFGEAITLRMGQVDPEARAAFEDALKIDPTDSRAHYYLGKQAVLDSRFDEARAHFRAALAAVPSNDVRDQQIAAELAAVDPAEAADKAMKTRISGMVAALDASLKSDPDNADGWARLLRSYDVLGDTAGHDRALAAVRSHFTPQQAADILAKSRAAVGAENTGGM